MTAGTEELVIPSLEEAVIGREDNPLRFERFCAEVYGADQGVTVVTTSRTWDQSRDGRTLAGPRHILCASLREDVDDKVSEDITKLSATTRPDAVVFCTSRPMTEYALDKIEAKIKALGIGTKCEVIPLARQQLADLARKHRKLLHSHYRSEIEEIRQSLFAPAYSSPESAEADALRLALCTHGRPDAAEFRGELLRTIVLEVVAAKGALTPNEIATAVYEDLRLSKPLAPLVVTTTIKELREKEFLSDTAGRLTATEKGKASLPQPEAGATRLQEGSEAVRATIEKNLGYTLQDDEYAKAWAVICSSLADIFFQNGIHIVRGVGLLLGEKPPARGDASLRDVAGLIEEVGKRAGANANTAERQKELSDAVADTLLEPGTPAFEWLSEVASTFVCIASLGLVGTPADAVRKCIARTILVPDTDVLLSLWCEGEPSHEECKGVHQGWRSIGGRFAAAPSVMDEVAHHAWIAEIDFDDTVSIRGRKGKDEAFRLIQNTFVRAYWLKAQKFSKSEFLEFIREYRGEADHDFRRVQAILLSDFKFSVMQEVGESDALAEKIRSFLLNVQFGYEVKKAFWEDKTRRDGVLLASVKAWNDKLAAEATDLTVCVLSSSTLLDRAATKFRPELGADLVMPLGAASYLLTMLPGSKISLASLRTVLFEPKRRRFSDLQRIALRALAATEQYSFPFSRRSTLQDKLTEALRFEARARGVTPEEQKSTFLKVAEPESNASVIAKAVDNLAIETRLEKENIELRRELEAMKVRMEKLKERK